MKIKHDQKLGEHTTMGIGGVIKYMFFPANGAELIEAINYCLESDISYFLLAGGSNTVFSDNVLYDQAVINLTQMTEFTHTKNEILVGPGFVLQDLVDFAQQNNLSGVTGLNRVPGTVGGAVIGNAGAYGCEICETVKSVSYLDVKEIEKSLKKSPTKDFEMVYSKLAQEAGNKGCEFGYRNSLFKKSNDLVVTEIKLELEQITDFTNELAEYDRIANIRDSVYPKGFMSPGSMFKNILFDSLPPESRDRIPPDWVVYGNKLPAGRLIQETVGLGKRIGNVGNREKHANILQNFGGGTYQDVVEFRDLVIKEVKEKFDIEMVPEIRIIPPDFADFQH